MKEVVKRIIAKKSSYEIISKSDIDSYKMSVHVLARMKQRNITPIEMIEHIDRGKQVTKDREIVAILYKNILSILNAKARKVLTVIDDDKFRNWTTEDVKRKKLSTVVSYLPRPSIKVRDLRKMKTIEDLDKAIQKLEGLKEETKKVKEPAKKAPPETKEQRRNIMKNFMNLDKKVAFVKKAMMKLKNQDKS